MHRRVKPGSVSVIVTSPPYNIGKKYHSYADSLADSDYLEWIGRVSTRCKTSLDDSGSLFVNLGSKPSNPWWPIEIASRIRDSGFTLQNTILWVKSIAISKEAVGDYPGITGDIAVGHFQPVNSPRYLNGLSEYIFHFTKRGDVPLDKLGVGVPYQDKSNVTRWGTGETDLRDRGTVWFIPYDTIRQSRLHPCVFPVKLPEMCVRLHGIERTALVMDPFVGTGTTALACDRLGLDFVGFEIDAHYAQLASEAIKSQRAKSLDYLERHPGETEIPWERLVSESSSSGAH